MRGAQVVAREALVQAQAASLQGRDHTALLIFLSALNYIASGARMYQNVWNNHLKSEASNDRKAT